MTDRSRTACRVHLLGMATLRRYVVFAERSFSLSGPFRLVSALLLGLLHQEIGLQRCAMAQSAGTSAQTGDYGDWHFRFDLFQMLFEQNGLRPIRDWKAALASPEETVIVSLGDAPLRSRSTELNQYLSRGGAMLVATDKSHSLSAELSIAAGPVLTYSNSDEYQGHRDCIRITDLDRAHPLASGVKELIANRTGWIRQRRSARRAWRAIAHLPQTTQQQNRGRPIVVLLDRAQTSGSCLIVAADHSLFTNGMMWHGDNAIFAINVSNYLCRQQRTQVLFLVDGDALNSYLVGPLADQLPIPPLDTEKTPELEVEQMLKVANSVVKHVEDSNVINKLVASQPRDMRESIYRRLLLNALAAGLVIIAISKLAGRTRGPTLPVARQTQRPASSERVKWQEDSPERRGQAARELSRNFCRELTRSPEPARWKQMLSPEAVAARGVDLPDDVRGNLSLVLSLAEREQSPHLTRSRLLEIGRAIAELKTLLTGGAS